MSDAVAETDLPAFSRLHALMQKDDFVDCYRVRSAMPPRPAADVIADFPGWAKFLLVIRKAVTAPFGLTNDTPSDLDKVGIFPVESETDREVIAGFDDKHLNFRVSVMSDEGVVYLATWVHPHGEFWRSVLSEGDHAVSHRNFPQCAEQVLIGWRHFECCGLVPVIQLGKNEQCRYRP